MSVASLVGLDWGTSSLRAYLFDQSGTILESRHRPHGIRALPEGGFNAALADVTAGWPNCPRLAAGMVGARGGWREVPYLDLPIDVAALGASLDSVAAADGNAVHLVPGLRNPGRPDVMRGEETQILGALALDPSLAAHATLVMPGTHSKWVSLRGGAIVDFHTSLTGELFATLLEHSIIGASPGGAHADDAESDARAAIFGRGVDEARDSGAAGGFSRLFAIRASMLSGALATDEIPTMLSGLLIGEEIRAMVAGKEFDVSGRVRLIGDSALCARYAMALERFSIDSAVCAEHVVAHGLWLIAANAGLVEAGAHSSLSRGNP